jgi:arylformamidase
MRSSIITLASVAAISIAGCSGTSEPQAGTPPTPRAIVDLGALVTEDLPERVWGKALLVDGGWYERGQNSFDVVYWQEELPAGTVSGSNSYYTIWNHGGPHVDAPNHVGLSGGIDSYPVETFIGPVKVFDVRGHSPGRTVDVDVFARQEILPGDIVLIYTGYMPPKDDSTYPSVITLTREASEYLAEIPVRAFGTDSQSVASIDDSAPVDAESVLAQVVPVHESFLSRGIPIYEELFNVDQLLGEDQLYFVGVPLNIQNGDGMIVRPVVLIY